MLGRLEGSLTDGIEWTVRRHLRGALAFGLQSTFDLFAVIQMQSMHCTFSVDELGDEDATITSEVDLVRVYVGSDDDRVYLTMFHKRPHIITGAKRNEAVNHRRSVAGQPYPICLNEPLFKSN